MNVAGGLCLDISGVAIRIGRLPAVGRKLGEDRAPFVAAEAPDPFLDVLVVAHDPRDDPKPFTAKGADLLFGGRINLVSRPITANL